MPTWFAAPQTHAGAGGVGFVLGPCVGAIGRSERFALPAHAGPIGSHGHSARTTANSFARTPLTGSPLPEGWLHPEPSGSWSGVSWSGSRRPAIRGMSVSCCQDTLGHSGPGQGGQRSAVAAETAAQRPANPPHSQTWSLTLYCAPSQGNPKAGPKSPRHSRPIPQLCHHSILLLS